MSHATTRLAFTRLQRSAYPEAQWEEFARSIDLEFSKADPDEQDLLALCLGELLRLYWPEPPFDLNAAVAALSTALPHLAAKMPKKCLTLLQGLQWLDVFEKLVDENTCAVWLEACGKVALNENNQIVLTALVPLVAKVVPGCSLDLFFELALLAPSFWARVAAVVDGLYVQVRTFFESSLKRGLVATSEVKLYADLAEVVPEVLCGYMMPICGSREPLIRQQAARAYAFLDPEETAWHRLSSDRDPTVRLEWARAAHLLGLDVDWTPLFCDPNEDARDIALKRASTAQLVPLLRHTDVAVAASVLRALCGSSVLSTVSFEGIVRFLSRDRDHLRANLAVARPLLDAHAHLALELEGKSMDALMWLSGHFLVYYSALQVLESGSPSQARATEKWLNSRVDNWHRLSSLKVTASSSDFEKYATPLFDAQWLIDTPEASELLEQAARSCPALLTGLLPRVTSTIPGHMLRVILSYARKLPYKLVNPATSILADMCQYDARHSYEAAEILRLCAPTFFEEMAPEFLEAALEAHNFRLMRVLSHVLPVLDYLRPMDPASSELYASIAPLDTLSYWLEQILPELEELQCRATLVAVLERDSLSVQCFPWIVKYMDAHVAEFAARRASQNYQLLPILCFYPAKIPKGLSLQGDKVYSAFCRVVFIGACLECDSQPVAVFCERFATRENIGTLVNLSKRLHNFELHEPNQYLYRYLEGATKILSQIKRENRWVGAASTVDVPMDCFKRHSSAGALPQQKRVRV